MSTRRPCVNRERTEEDDEIMEERNKQQIFAARQVKRNELGVQLLSRELHAQIFRDAPFPSPDPPYIQIARQHLEAHGLDPTQGSVLPNTSFTLPPLQGSNLAEHFHRIGARASQPWLSHAKRFSEAELPPKPSDEDWVSQSGWTKYHYLPGGSSFSEPVDYPQHDERPEELLCFDVETLHTKHPYPIMACAASPNAWYAWISPWLLGETDDPKQLIPIGDPTVPRIIVGHNVSFDRARILEEYNLKPTKNRFLDTMSLHVAVKGISSHQRPAWMQYKKEKQKEVEQQEEAFEAIEDLLEDTGRKLEREVDAKAREELERTKEELEESLAGYSPSLENGNDEAIEKRWEALTSGNSLADVAQLHCGRIMDKSVRNDFATHTREEIRGKIETYLAYCATDVEVTHEVYRKVLPDFLLACPHPVSFAGILTMGSSLLPVNQEWERYLKSAEGVYQEMEEKVKKKLLELAEQAKTLANYDYLENGENSEKNEPWKDDPWLNQLDWTPKVAGKSRGIVHNVIATDEPDEPETTPQPPAPIAPLSTPNPLPAWYSEVLLGPLQPKTIRLILPLILRLSYEGHPLQYDYKNQWHYLIDGVVHRLKTALEKQATQILCPRHALTLLQDGTMTSHDMKLAMDLSRLRRPADVEERVKALAKKVVEARREDISSDPWLSQLDWTPIGTEAASPSDTSSSPNIQLPTTPQSPTSTPKRKRPSSSKSGPKIKPKPVYWPKWYWEAAKPKKGLPPGTLDITTRNRLAPLLFKLSWKGSPLFWSREHGWIYRVSSSTPSSGSDAASKNPQARQPHTKPLKFHDRADDMLAESCLRDGYRFYKLPHKDGEEANVGSPLGKTFLKYLIDGTLRSPGEEAKEALDVNIKCSYWISARDRILNQLVVWQKEGKRWLGFEKNPGGGTTSAGQHAASTSMTTNTSLDEDDSHPVTGEKEGSEGDQKLREEKWGIILPQVITMGTVTRRAIEKTWLTASNAKPNRVGSELKAMVRAPEGYSIVGADVDSEELWISSCMGDAQFGLHGATALGWMTLEGTKSAGTDLHSKTASILGISRDQAKVFNYSRIYGAGKRHAVLLLLQANPGMSPEEAKKLATDLYASTKGKNTNRLDIFERKLWFGGTESFVFNKLEEIALSDKPQTPALGCGVTYALSKEYLPSEFGADFMPSRINWVVQSSGVDYLHLLIVSMDHLIQKYDIKARYLISVHDELRYLVEDGDRYRAALALQIANLWTRCLFAYRLGMDDLPQGVAFFSAVDVDWVLRKEVDMPCVTPSQPKPIPPGESLDIVKLLEKTNGGTLQKDGSPMPVWASTPHPRGSAPQPRQIQSEVDGELDGYEDPNCLVHRAKNASFLRAQATTDFGEVKGLAQQVYGRKFTGGIGESPRPRRKDTTKSSSVRSVKKASGTPLKNGEDVDYDDFLANAYARRL
ncbi:hypothetical protein AX16_002549 [Volvariella volvacea WC 439]|nr:hypothetical protein AX16_002549 [Volvariella volvacea WC 439]